MGDDGHTALRYMPALDGLRALAVAGVLAFHLGALDGGFLGVDLFFVLSGFLITSLLLTELRSRGTVRLGRFWARRARRLLPALFLVLLAVSAYAFTGAAHTELERIRDDAWSTLLYVANWHALWSERGYWELFSTPSPLDHAWSLAIEEQFYLAWPLAVLLLARKRTAWVLGGSCLLALASAAAMALLYQPGADAARVYYGTDTRASALLIGAALAAGVARWGWAERPGARRAIEGCAGVGAAFLAVVWYAADGQGAFLYRGGFLASQLAVAALLLAVSHPEPGRIARLLSWAPLRALGKISYGVYLWHWPVFVALAEPRLGFGGAPLVALKLAVTLALSIASYHLVELPIRRGGLPGWRMALVAPASIVAVAGAVWLGTAEAAARPLAAPRHAPWRDVGERARAKADPLRLLVVGDSVAERLAVHLESIRDELAIEVENGGRAGCGLFGGPLRFRRPDGVVMQRGAECRDFLARWSASARDEDAALVVLGAPVRGAWEIDGAFRQACDEAFDRAFGEELSRGIDALAAGGAAVFVATMPAPTGSDYGPAEDRRTECLNRSIEARVHGHPSARLLDLAAYVCPREGCRTHIEDVLLRHDGLHFQQQGAQLVGWWLVRGIREARRHASLGAGG